MVFHSRRTKIGLTGMGIAAVTAVQQALQVLTGEFVELEHLPLTFDPMVPAGNVGRQGETYKVNTRFVTVDGAGKLFPSHRRFKLTCQFVIGKENAVCKYTRWEVQGSALFMIIFEDRQGIECYEAMWKYSSANFPEVSVVAARLAGHQKLPRDTFKVGRDRAERREEHEQTNK